MIRYLYLQTYESPLAVVATDFEDTWAELYIKEYSEREKERLESMGVMFQGNRIIKNLKVRDDSPSTIQGAIPTGLQLRIPL
jgi:hypothetical protein